MNQSKVDVSASVSCITIEVGAVVTTRGGRTIRKQERGKQPGSITREKQETGSLKVFTWEKDGKTLRRTGSTELFKNAELIEAKQEAGVLVFR